MLKTGTRIAAVGATAALLATAIGGVSASVRDASAQTINVGCTNSTTDSSTIQNAINSSHVGDTVQITGGKCDITSTITLLPDRTYTGTDTSGTTLTQAANENLQGMLVAQGWSTPGDAYVDDGIRIEHLTLDGNSAANTSGTTNVLILRNYNFRVYDVRIENAPHDGVLLTTSAQDGTALANGMINSVLSDLWIDGAGYDGVQVIDPPAVNKVTDDVLQRSWIDDTGHDAVDLQDAAGWNLDELHLYGVKANAIEAGRCFNTSITNNYIEDFGKTGASGTTYYGIYCGLQGGSANVIADNKVNYTSALPASGTFDYISASGNYGSTNVAVTGNNIVGAGTSRETGLIYSVGSATATNVSSTGNLVSAVGTSKSVSGASVTAGQ